MNITKTILFVLKYLKQWNRFHQAHFPVHYLLLWKFVGTSRKYLLIGKILYSGNLIPWFVFFSISFSVIIEKCSSTRQNTKTTKTSISFIHLFLFVQMTKIPSRLHVGPFKCTILPYNQFKQKSVNNYSFLLMFCFPVFVLFWLLFCLFVCVFFFQFS